MKRLELSGTAYARGLLHGQSCASEIQEFAEIRKSLLVSALKNWSSQKLNNLLDKHLEVLKKDSELWDEFRGIAEGSKTSLRDLMILNNHTDLRDFGESDYDESLLECSCFAFKKGPKLVAGQSWDMHGSAEPFVIHLSIDLGSHKQEIFSLAGCLGLAGVNSHGLGVFINNLRSREVDIGFAWPAVVRKLLTATNTQEAKQLLRAHMPSGGRNFLLVDHSQATNVETTSKQIAEHGNLNNGFTFHTNHYLSHLKSTEEESTRSKTTLDRYECLEKHASIAIKSDISIKSVSEELFNKTETTISIPRSLRDPHASATCGGILYNFNDKKGLSFKGLYSNNDTLNFSL